MRELWWIALASFRETVRDKILYTLLFFMGLLFAFSMLMGQWSVFAKDKVMTDFSLGVMSMGGLFVSLFIGVGLIQKEIQRKTIFTLLSKPVRRSQFLVGKYFGLLLVVLVNVVVMMAGLLMALWVSDCPISPRLAVAAYALFWEMGIVTAVALLFSSFSTPVVSSLMTLGVYIAGHLSGDIVQYIQSMIKNAEKIPGSQPIPEWYATLAQVTQAGLPNLELFNIRAQVVHNLPLPDLYMVWVTLHGTGWIALLLGFASWHFSRRDFV